MKNRFYKFSSIISGSILALLIIALLIFPHKISTFLYSNSFSSYVIGIFSSLLAGTFAAVTLAWFIEHITYREHMKNLLIEYWYTVNSIQKNLLYAYANFSTHSLYTQIITFQEWTSLCGIRTHLQRQNNIGLFDKINEKLKNLQNICMEVQYTETSINQQNKKLLELTNQIIISYTSKNRSAIKNEIKQFSEISRHLKELQNNLKNIFNTLPLDPVSLQKEIEELATLINDIKMPSLLSHIDNINTTFYPRKF